MAPQQVPPRSAPSNSAVLSRRQFIGKAAAATGVALGSGAWSPLLAQNKGKGDGDPRPIPGGTTLGPFPTPDGPVPVFVHFNPGIADQTREALLITDFHGFMAVARNTGAGTAVGANGKATRLVYSTDVRVMAGVYRDVSGRFSYAVWCFL